MKDKGEILANILMDFKDCNLYLHNTREFNVVKKVMDEGFIFENQLSYSTDRVNPDENIEITYFLFQRKDYGSYTIIIAIPKTTYEIYIRISNNSDIGIEDLLTITKPYTGENDELIYTLSPKHVLGYFNITTAEFIKNRNWDPAFTNHQNNNP